MSGWAALPPEDIVAEYRDEPTVWVFVRGQDFVAPRIVSVILPVRQYSVFIRQTVIVNRTVLIRDRGPRFAVNPGISPAIIAAVSRRPLRAYEVRPVVLAGTAKIPGALEVRAQDMRGRNIRDQVTVRQTQNVIRPADRVQPPQPLAAGEQGRLGDNPPRAARGGAPQPTTGQGRQQQEQTQGRGADQPRQPQKQQPAAEGRGGPPQKQPPAAEGRGGPPQSSSRRPRAAVVRRRSSRRQPRAAVVRRRSSRRQPRAAVVRRRSSRRQPRAAVVRRRSSRRQPRAAVVRRRSSRRQPRAAVVRRRSSRRQPRAAVVRRRSSRRQPRAAVVRRRSSSRQPRAAAARDAAALVAVSLRKSELRYKDGSRQIDGRLHAARSVIATPGRRVRNLHEAVCRNARRRSLSRDP